MSTVPKVVSIAEAVTAVRAAQAAGESVVMCHGCFDLVHPGHVRHLQQAARQGSRLLVTITSDAGVDKGGDRPLIPQELRAENLAALDCVDWVAVNTRPTAAEILAELKPDVYVKGREYEHNRDERFRLEKETVERCGGRVVLTSGDVVFSSTALIRTLGERATPQQAAMQSLMETHGLTPSRVETLIGSFHGKRVLVIGESMIDTYVLCDRPDIAGEGPIMTLRPIEWRSFDGGAAIIARHLAAMGGRPTVLTALPRSSEAEALRQRLTLGGCQVRWLEHADTLVEKQRFLVGSSKVMKLDLGQPMTLDATDQQRFIGDAVEIADGCDAVVIADYGLGLLTSGTLAALCEALRPRVDLLVGDVSGRRSNLLAMRDADLLCPSEIEIREALHDFDQGLSSVAWRLLHDTRSRAAIVPLGDQGVIVFDGPAEGDDWSSRLRADHVPPLADHPVDLLGCDDALLAAATATLAGGGTLVQAGLIGAIASTIESQKLGNAAIGAAELRRGVARLYRSQIVYEAEPATLTVRTARDQLSVANS